MTKLPLRVKLALFREFHPIAFPAFLFAALVGIVAAIPNSFRLYISFAAFLAALALPFVMRSKKK